jgi:hypothetical protein
MHKSKSTAAPEAFFHVRPFCRVPSANKAFWLAVNRLNLAPEYFSPDRTVMGHWRVAPRYLLIKAAY